LKRCRKTKNRFLTGRNAGLRTSFELLEIGGVE
jgi:hypothetical protein